MSELRYGDHIAHITRTEQIQPMCRAWDEQDRQQNAFEEAMRHNLGHEFDVENRRCRHCGRAYCDWQDSKPRITWYNYREFLCPDAVLNARWRRMFGYDLQYKLKD